MYVHATNYFFEVNIRGKHEAVAIVAQWQSTGDHYSYPGFDSQYLLLLCVMILEDDYNYLWFDYQCDYSCNGVSVLEVFLVNFVF